MAEKMSELVEIEGQVDADAVAWLRDGAWAGAATCGVGGKRRCWTASVHALTAGSAPAEFPAA